MKIRFTKDSEIEVVEYYDEENDKAVTTKEIFKKDEVTEIDILNDERNDGTIDVQFGDGTVCFGLLKECFEIIGD